MTPSPRVVVARRLMFVAVAVLVTAQVVGVVMAIAYRPDWDLLPPIVPTVIGSLLSLPSFVGVPVLGYLVIARRPERERLVGFLLLGIGVAWAILAVGDLYGSFSYQVLDRPLPFARAVVWLPQAMWDLAHITTVILLVLLPTGRPHSRVWGIVAWALVAYAGVYTLVLLFGETPYFFPLGRWTTVPKTFLVAQPIVTQIEAIHEVVRVMAPHVRLLGVVALLARLHGATGIARRQIAVLAAGATLWYLSVVFITVPCTALGFSVDIETSWCVPFVGSISGATLWGAIAVAVFRYRLWAVEVVVNKGLVYGVLAAFVGVVYVGVVSGLGAILGATDRPHLGLSVLATAVVAIGFQPVRERAQRTANRLVYGQRWSPYDVMRDLSHRLGEDISLAEVLERIAESAARGVGATSARMRLLRGTEERVGDWPRDGRPTAPVLTIPVIHQGALIGELWVEKAAGDPISASDEKFLADLASQTALALQNVRLSDELQARLEEISRQAEELRESRRRIVAAQDEERRKIERDLHDGAQQRLATLSVELSMARRGLRPDADPEVGAVLEHAREGVQSALAELRELASGIHPAELTAAGLPTVLRSLAQRIPVPVTVIAPDERFPPAIEAAAYFVVCEAMANIVKHAGATHATVEVARQGETLTVSIRDDGRGGAQPGAGSGLTGLVDRVAAIGGRLRVDSPPGGGTQVIAEIPVTTRAASG